MRQSKAKERILKTAEKKIRQKGYTNLNVNDIAYLAKVSIGTLYYHFPEGKTSILAELLSRMQQKAFESSGSLLQSNELLGGDTFDEILCKLLQAILDIRKNDRHFLAAVQIEMLADIDKYENVVESLESLESMNQGWKMFVEFIDNLVKKFPKESFNIKGHEIVIERMIGTLMTYQIMFPEYFGTDSEFVEKVLARANENMERRYRLKAQ
ncbi:MAG: TetR/AcrR family transcriptional regulator, partial [Candidatus Thorarchaeota archaeon]